MYFATDENGLVISFGPESYPDAHYVDSDLLPNGWVSIFKSCRLGFLNGEFVDIGSGEMHIDNDTTSSDDVSIFDVAK